MSQGLMLIDESVETLRLTLRTGFAVSTRGTRSLASRDAALNFRTGKESKNS